MTNRELTELLRNVAAVYLLTHENKFKIRAYERAADTIDALDRELYDIYLQGKLESIEGIGSSIISHLNEYFARPKKSHLVSVLKLIPASVFVLMNIPGVGPKKAYKLVTKLHLTNVDTIIAQLKQACTNHKVASLESFGETSEQDILEGIIQYETSIKKEYRMTFPYAQTIANEMVDYLQKNKKVIDACPVGSLRRGVSTIGDIDIAVICEKQNEDEILAYFTNTSHKKQVIEKGDKKAAILTQSGRRVDIRVCSPSEAGSMLQYFTGSKEHNVQLRTFALKKGLSLSEYGIKQSDKLLRFKDEESFYKKLGLSYIPPELREGKGEIEAARDHTLPKLIEEDDIKGDFHIHSSYDLASSHDEGVDTYEQILKKAHERHYLYVAFSDHNPRMSRHTSSDIVKILKKRKEHIEKQKFHTKFPHISYYISLEVDILSDGSPALPKDALPFIDMMIVSIHSSFSMSKKDMTTRILHALECPKVKILGHPTTRLLGKRGEIDVEWNEVFARCAKRHIALEINASPSRLDLPDELVRQAKSHGVKFAINTDAHGASQMDLISYGVKIAKRGGLSKKEVINSFSTDVIEKWIRDI